VVSWVGGNEGFFLSAESSHNSQKPNENVVSVVGNTKNTAYVDYACLHKKTPGMMLLTLVFVAGKKTVLQMRNTRYGGGRCVCGAVH